MRVGLSTLALAAGILTPVAAITAQEIPSDTPLSSLLESAQRHLAKGEKIDALTYYDAAINRDPSNYLTFFRRATINLSMGRNTQATDDLHKVLALRPGFEEAHYQLGKVRAKSADWEAARKEYQLAHKTEELAELDEAHAAALQAEEADKKGDVDECVAKASEAIMVANRAPKLREIRAKCHFAKGDLEEGMADLQHVLQIKPGDTKPHVLISATTFFALGDFQKGLTAVRKCLHSDPDSKVCKKLLKEEKAIEKAVQKIQKAIERDQYVTAARQLVPTADEEGLIKRVRELVQEFKADGTIPSSAKSVLELQLVEMACQAYHQSNSKKAKQWCDESLSLDENSLYGLLHRAKAQSEAEDYEASLATYRKAQEHHPDKRQIIDPLLQEAEVALKRSKTKDYYKVLGVARDADERQIKSAYRKLSKQFHPDKAAQKGVSKEDAERKMATINEAYEVLSNPELRQRFDHGDDPNSHEQQGGGGFPFHGSPFGHGGPQQFMFKGGHGGNSFKFTQGGFFH